MSLALTRMGCKRCLVWTVLLCSLAGSCAHASCINEKNWTSSEESRGVIVEDANAPRLLLQGLVRDAIERSHAIGAAQLLADAALSDIQESSAQGKTQASLLTTLSASHLSGDNIDRFNGAKSSLGLNLGAPLADGGRVKELTSWRTQLALAARLGQLSLQEQIAAQTVSLALERNRYRMQSQLYAQYGRKMGCLVQALEQIVKLDKGRASELVQARKTQKQAQISQDLARTTMRLIETRLARLVGQGIPNGEGLSSLLLDLPKLEELWAQAERSNDIEQLGAQALAMQNYAQSVSAGSKPQVNWVWSANRSAGGDNTSSMLAGVNVLIPILNPGTQHSIRSAEKRAQAASLQRTEALQARRYRILEVHEQAHASFKRASDFAKVIRDSNQLRGYTLQQWQQLGRRSLFDVIGTESEYFQLRIAYLNSLHDGQQANALLYSLGLGLNAWLQ